MLEKIAILCSDLHLSHVPPMARSGEPDWYEAMARPLREVSQLAEDGDLPVLCGGDVFDRWSSPPELVNFAMKHLPCRFWSIAGQHDLPYHSWENRRKSSFWTLVLSQTIRELWDGGCGLGVPVKSQIRAWGFNWGEELLNGEPEDCASVVKVLVAHQYVWLPGYGHPGVSSERNELLHFLERLRGYDVALFGDNHKGFLRSLRRLKVEVSNAETMVRKCVDEAEYIEVFNAGTMMRRCVDEVNYRPMVGVLFEDGSVEPHHLDTSQDVFDSSDEMREAEQVVLNLDSFLNELQGLGGTGLDFRRAVEIAMNREQVSLAVRKIILNAMEKDSSGS